MYIRLRYGNEIHTVTDISKKALVSVFQKRVQELTGLKPKEQRLIFRGKELDPRYTLFDFDLDVNCLVDLTKRTLFSKEEQEEIEKKIKEDQEQEKENESNNSQSNEGGDSAPPTDLPGPSNPSESEATTMIKIEDIYDGNPKDLEPKYDCKKCRDNPDKDCGECGCNECKKKNDTAVLLMCDECEYCYHTYCLDPPLESVPEGDWYCPVCKNDEDEIVKPGAMLKKNKKKDRTPGVQCKRDWGNGMATSGRQKTCTKVPPHHFGQIPGIDVGMTWKYRIQLSEEGLHRPPVAGIAGKPTEGCFSIVLAGGYEDDVDDGEEFKYTGAGGRDLSGNKRTAEQSFDQVLDKTNLAIAVSIAAKLDKENGADSGDNWQKGKPIRVVRTEKLKKHSKYAPEEGCRYDGIYKCVKCWPEKGQAGFIVWRFLFRRDDASPAPWTEEGKQLMEDNGYSCIFPAGYHENLAAKELKAAAKKGSSSGKGKGKGKKRKTEEESEGPETPQKAEAEIPVKKAKLPEKLYKISENFLEVMDKDIKNAKLWAELKENSYCYRLNFIEKIEEQFCCATCMELVNEPVTLECSHNICRTCLERAFKSDYYECPNCRADLKDLKDDPLEVNSALVDALHLICPGK